jgi:Icc-related predicted phosphoesterase
MNHGDCIEIHDGKTGDTIIVNPGHCHKGK